MKSTLKILIFAKPYVFLIFLNCFFNFFSVIFSLFSISLIIPILGLLFGTIEPSNGIIESLSFNNLKDYFYNHIYIITQNKGVIHTLGLICFLVSIGTILKNTFRYCALYCLTPLRNNVIRDIREKMYNKLLKLELSFVNKFKQGDIVSRMTSDLIEIEWSIMGVLEFFIKDPIHIFLFLIALIYISPQLTLIGLIFLPITAIIIIKISKSLKQTSNLSQIKIADIISILEESISNLKIIKSFSGYLFMSKHFNSHNESLKKINNQVLWRKDLASPMSEMLSTLVIVAIIWCGSKIVLNNNLDADSFIGYLIIFSQILPPAKSLTTAFYSIQKGAAAAQRVFLILEQPIQKNSCLRDVSAFDEVVFNKVYFKQNNVFILNNINTAFKRGDKIAIVGESGSGKSTLLELMLKFYKNTSGNIMIDNTNIRDINTANLFSLVTQDVMLFNDTIFNNLILGKNDATMEEVQRATKAANIHDFIINLDEGYNAIISERGNNLSGGEKQRVSLARAFLRNSPIIILDEPTSALDGESSNYITSSIDDLNQSKTIITITHKLSSITNYNKILVMDKGEIVQSGNHAFLLKNCTLYKKLYEIETLKKNEKN